MLIRSIADEIGSLIFPLIPVPNNPSMITLKFSSVLIRALIFPNSVESLIISVLTE